MQQSDSGDLEKKDRSGNTPLHLAAQSGHMDVVKTLLGLGAPVNQKNHEGETPLHLAAGAGHKEVVRILLDSGADPTLADNNGAKASHRAAAEGFIEILDLISRRDGNEERGDGDRNFIGSLDNENSKKSVKPIELENHTKAKIAKDKIGENSNTTQPQDPASRSGAGGDCPRVADPRSVVRQDSVGKDWMSEELDTMLGEYIVKAAINEINAGGVEVNSGHYETYTPLHMAIRFGWEEAAREFIKKNADVHATTGSGLSTVMLAAIGGSVPIIKMLVKAGADLVQNNRSRLTPIHLASHFGHDPVLRYLQSLGLDVNAQGRRGDTALHIVVRREDIPMAITLLAFGASRDIPNEMGITARMIAANSSNVHLRELIECWGT